MTSKKRSHKTPEKAGNSDIANLLTLTAIQLAGFVVLELIVFLLISLGVIPPTLVVTQNTLFMIEVNTAYMVVICLLAVLVASLWLAVLVEFTDLVQIKEVKIRLW